MGPEVSERESAQARGGRSPGVHGMHVLGLRVPVDEREPMTVVEVEPTPAALQEHIGGGPLDDGYAGTVDGDRYIVYLDEERAPKRLRLNNRLAVLAARLEREDRVPLRGDALVLGRDRDGAHDVPVDVPEGVLAAASRAGLMRG